jgi:hypothetical protein
MAPNLGLPNLAISGVNPSNKTLLVSNLEQQSGKRVALLRAENGE